MPLSSSNRPRAAAWSARLCAFTVFVSGPLVRAGLTEYDALVSAGPPTASRLTNAVTLDGSSGVPFSFGAVSGAAAMEFIVQGTTAGPDCYLAVGSNTASNLRYEQNSESGQMGMTLLGVEDYKFTPGVPSPSSATHIVYVWDGAGTMKLYRNGFLAGTNSSVSTNFSMPTGAGRLGSNPSNSERMTGVIHRVTAYDDVPSEADILRRADAFLGIARVPEIAEFRAVPAVLSGPGNVTLSWNVSGAETLTLDGADVTGLSTRVVAQTATATHTLRAVNGNGEAVRELEVPVAAAAGHIVINELVADNESGVTDSDGEYADWLELHNPTAEPVNLAGLFLTDRADRPQMWPLPAVPLTPGGFRLVLLTGKNRTEPNGEWHTNFKPSKGGEYLALTNGMTAVHAFSPAFPPLEEDQAYGLAGADPALAGYLPAPTPGAANPGPLLPGRVLFSQPPGLIREAFDLTLTCPTPGARIFYNLNHGATETLFTGPIRVSTGTLVEARAEKFGSRGAESRAGYVKLAADLAAHTSPLPVLVIDNFSGGVIPQKGWTATGADVRQVAQQSAAWVAWEKDGGTAVTASEPQLYSQIGIRGRGAYSSTWREKPFAVEAKSETGGEEKVSVLGMPAHDNWNLYFPEPVANKDETMLFNTFIYDLSRRGGRYAARFRWVEVFLNEDGGEVSQTDRRGVYAVMEKISRGSDRLDFEKLSTDGTQGGWLLSLNRMDAIPETGWPAANGARTPQFFRTAGANRAQETTPNNPAQIGDDEPRQHNGFLNFDNPGGYTINPAQRASIEGWFRSFEDTLHNNTLWRDPVNGYRKWIDDTDFAEYFIFNELTKNGDGLLISMYPWKGNDGKLRMGPAWDYNIGGYYSTGATDSLRWRGDRLWYARLFADPDFLQLHIDRWFAWRAGVMSNAGMDQIIDEQAAEITPGMAVKQGIPSAATWTSRLNNMKSWLKTRANWVDGQYVRPPVASVPGGLVPAGQTVTLTAPAGTIQRLADGADPRLPGGASAAGVLSGGAVVVDTDTRVTARAKSGTRWSAPFSAVYVTGAIPATSGDLRVTEIHYHPAAPTPAEVAAGFAAAEDFGFIEITNTAAGKVSLLGLRLVSGNGATFAFDEGNQWSLEPGARLVVVKNIAAFRLRYGADASAAGAFSGTLGGGGDGVSVLGAADAALISVTFGNMDPWPVGADGAGYSLTLSTGADPALPASWRTSVAPGGSPGADDSVPLPAAGDLLAYALGARAPELTPAPEPGGALTLRQSRVPGSDSVDVTMEQSADLSTWTPLGAALRPDVRGAGGTLFQEWDVSPAGGAFFRLRVTTRP